MSNLEPEIVPSFGMESTDARVFFHALARATNEEVRLPSCFGRGSRETGPRSGFGLHGTVAVKCRRNDSNKMTSGAEHPRVQTRRD